MMVRGLKVPPLGSVKDKYLQLLMVKETEKEYARVSTLIYAIWATVGGEATQTMAGNASKYFDKLSELLTPYVKRDDPNSEKRQLAMLKRMMTGFGYDAEEGMQRADQVKPKKKKRQSIWEKMLGKKEDPDE